MKITLLVVNKTDIDYIKIGIDQYVSRLKHYCDFKIETINPKGGASLSSSDVKKLEGELIVKHIQKADRIILLDEHGDERRSTQFASHIQKLANASIRNVYFVIGGAYGFSQQVYDIAHEKMSLSQMTFNHQMVRLFFVEQLYRAFTIINNEKYHNE